MRIHKGKVNFAKLFFPGTEGLLDFMSPAGDAGTEEVKYA